MTAEQDEPRTWAEQVETAARINPDGVRRLARSLGIDEEPTDHIDDVVRWVLDAIRVQRVQQAKDRLERRAWR